MPLDHNDSKFMMIDKKKMTDAKANRVDPSIFNLPIGDKDKFRTN